LRINENLDYKKLTEQYRRNGEKKKLENTYLKLYADGKIKCVEATIIGSYRRIEWESKRTIGERRD